ncbi:unnamed protein product, partial [Didymodactylos carnosus]
NLKQSNINTGSTPDSTAAQQQQPSLFESIRQTIATPLSTVAETVQKTIDILRTAPEDNEVEHNKHDDTQDISTEDNKSILISPSKTERTYHEVPSYNHYAVRDAEPLLENFIRTNVLSNEKKVEDDLPVKEGIITRPSTQMQVLNDTYPWYSTYSELIETEDKLSLVYEQLSKTLDSISQPRETVVFQPEPYKRLSIPDYDQHVLSDTSVTLEKVHKLAEISNQITKVPSFKRDEIESTQTQQPENTIKISTIEVDDDGFVPVVRHRKRTVSSTQDKSEQLESAQFRDKKSVMISSDIDLKPVIIGHRPTLTTPASEIVHELESVSSVKQPLTATKNKKQKKKHKHDKEDIFFDAPQPEILRESVSESTITPLSSETSAPQQTNLTKDPSSMQSRPHKLSDFGEIPTDISARVNSVKQEMEELDEQLKQAIHKNKNEEQMNDRLSSNSIPTSKPNETLEDKEYQQQPSTPESETQQSILKSIQQTVTTPILAVSETIQKIVSDVVPFSTHSTLKDESQALVIPKDTNLQPSNVQVQEKNNETNISENYVDNQTNQGSIFTNLKDSISSTLSTIKSAATDILQPTDSNEPSENKDDTPKLEQQEKRSKKSRKQNKRPILDVSPTTIVRQDNGNLSSENPAILETKTDHLLSSVQSESQKIPDKEVSIINENFVSQSSMQEKADELSRMPIHSETLLERPKEVLETEEATSEHRNATSLQLDNNHSKANSSPIGRKSDINEQESLLTTLKKQITSTVSTIASSVMSPQDSKDAVKNEVFHEVSAAKEKKNKKNKKQKKELVSDLSTPTDGLLNKEDFKSEILPSKTGNQELEKLQDAPFSSVSYDKVKTMDTPVLAEVIGENNRQQVDLVDSSTSKSDGQKPSDEIIITTHQSELPSSNKRTDTSAKKTKKKKVPANTELGVESSTIQDLLQSQDKQDAVSTSITNIKADEVKRTSVSPMSSITATESLETHVATPPTQSTTSTIPEQSPDDSSKFVTTTDDSEWKIQNKGKSKSSKKKDEKRSLPLSMNLSSTIDPTHNQLSEKVSDTRVQADSDDESTVTPTNRIQISSPSDHTSGIDATVVTKKNKKKKQKSKEILSTKLSTSPEFQSSTITSNLSNQENQAFPNDDIKLKTKPAPSSTLPIISQPMSLQSHLNQEPTIKTTTTIASDKNGDEQQLREHNKHLLTDQTTYNDALLHTAVEDDKSASKLSSETDTTGENDISLSSYRDDLGRLRRKKPRKHTISSSKQDDELSQDYQNFVTSATKDDDNDDESPEKQTISAHWADAIAGGEDQSFDELQMMDAHTIERIDNSETNSKFDSVLPDYMKRPFPNRFRIDSERLPSYDRDISSPRSSSLTAERKPFETSSEKTLHSKNTIASEHPLRHELLLKSRRTTDITSSPLSTGSDTSENETRKIRQRRNSSERSEKSETSDLQLQPSRKQKQRPKMLKKDVEAKTLLTHEFDDNEIDDRRNLKSSEQETSDIVSSNIEEASTPLLEKIANKLNELTVNIPDVLPTITPQPQEDKTAIKEQRIDHIPTDLSVQSTNEPVTGPSEHKSLFGNLKNQVTSVLSSTASTISHILPFTNKTQLQETPSTTEDQQQEESLILREQLEGSRSELPKFDLNSIKNAEEQLYKTMPHVDRTSTTEKVTLTDSQTTESSKNKKKKTRKRSKQDSGHDDSGNIEQYFAGVKVQIDLPTTALNDISDQSDFHIIKSKHRQRSTSELSTTSSNKQQEQEESFADNEEDEDFSIRPLIIGSSTHSQDLEHSHLPLSPEIGSEVQHPAHPKKRRQRKRKSTSGDDVEFIAVLPSVLQGNQDEQEDSVQIELDENNVNQPTKSNILESIPSATDDASSSTKDAISSNRASQDNTKSEGKTIKNVVPSLQASSSNTPSVDEEVEIHRDQQLGETSVQSTDLLDRMQDAVSTVTDRLNQTTNQSLADTQPQTKLDEDTKDEEKSGFFEQLKPVHGYHSFTPNKYQYEPLNQTTTTIDDVQKKGLKYESGDAILARGFGKWLQEGRSMINETTKSITKTTSGLTSATQSLTIKPKSSNDDEEETDSALITSKSSSKKEPSYISEEKRIHETSGYAVNHPGASNWFNTVQWNNTTRQSPPDHDDKNKQQKQDETRNTEHNGEVQQRPPTVDSQASTFEERQAHLNNLSQINDDTLGLKFHGLESSSTSSQSSSSSKIWDPIKGLNSLDTLPSTSTKTETSFSPDDVQRCLGEDFYREAIEEKVFDSNQEFNDMEQPNVSERLSLNNTTNDNKKRTVTTKVVEVRRKGKQRKLDDDNTKSLLSGIILEPASASMNINKNEDDIADFENINNNNNNNPIDTRGLSFDEGTHFVAKQGRSASVTDSTTSWEVNRQDTDYSYALIIDDDTYMDIPVRQHENKEQPLLSKFINNDSNSIDQHSNSSNQYGDFTINDDNEIMPITQFYPSMIDSVGGRFTGILSTDDSFLSTGLINNVEPGPINSYSNRRKPSDSLKSFNIRRKNHQKKYIINDQDDEIYLNDTNGVYRRRRPTLSTVNQTNS